MLASALPTGYALAQAALPAGPPPAPAVAADSAARPPAPEPLVLVNAAIIVSGNSLAAIRPTDIANVVVYKGNSPVGRWSVPARWRTVAGTGVVAITLKKGVRVASRSLRSLKRQLHVTGPVRYQLNGRPLEDETLRIAAESIETLAAYPPAPGAAATIVDIRLKPYQPQPSTDPPGTIRIRGVAGR